MHHLTVFRSCTIISIYSRIPLNQKRSFALPVLLFHLFSNQLCFCFQQFFVVDLSKALLNIQEFCTHHLIADVSTWRILRTVVGDHLKSQFQGRSQDYFVGGSDLKWPECLKGKAWVLPLDHV